MKKIIFTLLFLPLFFLATNTQAQQIVEPRAVLELFTSQGCHSCPPADKIVGEYATNINEKNILALSWHVDYWNYLGWQDIFSNKKFTQRQKLYAKTFGSQNIYTPQAVINGKTHVVGSAKQKIASAINKYQTIIVPLEINQTKNKLTISAEGELLVGSQLTIIYFQPSQAVKIERGENSGKTITYHNIVKDFVHYNIEGDKINLTLPIKNEKKSMAILLQKKQVGIFGEMLAEIIGAKILYFS